MKKNAYKKETDTTSAKITKKTRFNPLKRITPFFSKISSNKKVSQVVGVTLFVISAFLLLAFSSFLLTWKVDQNIINNHWNNPNIKVENLIKFYKNNKRCFDQLNKTISKLDLGIEKMEIAETNNGLLAQFEHYGLDGPTYYFEESVGTRKIIEVFPFIYNALEEGSIVIIDELDVNLHPLLIPLIVNLFNDTSNKNNAQLLFSAHNVVILDHLEKEQIFLVEKKEKGSASEVFCAANIKELRRSPSLMKKYISGELKAIPKNSKVDVIVRSIDKKKVLKWNNYWYYIILTKIHRFNKLFSFKSTTKPASSYLFFS